MNRTELSLGEGEEKSKQKHRPLKIYQYTQLAKHWLYKTWLQSAHNQGGTPRRKQNYLLQAQKSRYNELKLLQEFWLDIQ